MFQTRKALERYDVTGGCCSSVRHTSARGSEGINVLDLFYAQLQFEVMGGCCSSMRHISARGSEGSVVLDLFYAQVQYEVTGGCCSYV